LAAWYDDNPEHLWAWDEQGVEEMLVEAGWETIDAYIELDFPHYYYNYQIWGVS
jgi:hypothetical protein